ncbi:MAG: deoxyribodipyrimidine photo-lyase [Gloeobacteraceae cyanobacterium ES-bin-144]|nr:deoxyribodipyrimidine photo-lyase [Verrucomicrobiales bacterium]
MADSQTAVIHWYRRDLRISDNLAFFHAAATGLPVIPVYFLSDWKKSHTWTGHKRQQFLCGCLDSLSKNLGAVGGRLLIRKGDPVSGLRKLIIESHTVALHFNNDPDPFGKTVENHIRKMCAEIGVECHGHADATLHQPDEVLTQSGQPYRVYTPYSRNWLALPKPIPLGKPSSIRTPTHLPSLEIPTVAHWGLRTVEFSFPEPSERAARLRLKHAVSGKIQAYATKRDLPAAGGTSRISQDLRFGLISIRTVFAEAMKARTSANVSARSGIDTFIKELAWREFYFAILHFYPNVLDEEFNADWRGLPWDEPSELFDAWKEGRTGFPIVDAGMRELLHTGFMHNRVRMITAMFLTKDLHIDWKQGESHFMQHLLDGEIASNNGGWQWSAGTGADAAPYFRIQNPWSQTLRYDPAGIYIKRWLPELATVHHTLFMEPPKAGKPIAPGYPAPCLDHKTERERTLAIFKRHRSVTLDSRQYP